MQENASGAVHKWTRKETRAAQMVAEDRVTDEQIAQTVGINPATLWRWKQTPWFQERVASIVEEFKNKVLSEGIADRRNRMKAYNDRWEKLERIVEARGEELAGETPGGETGLLVREVAFVKVLEARTNTPKNIEDFEDEEFIPTKQSKLVYEYSLDTGLLSAMKDLEKQAAIEAGQWQEKTEVSGTLSVVREYPEGL